MTGHPSPSELESAFEKRLSRYLVGIDLGTTNCAVAFVDSKPSIPASKCSKSKSWWISRHGNARTRYRRSL